MGYRAFATCRECGHRDKHSLGAGWSDHLTHAFWPVWCDGCGKMGSTNYKERPLKCRYCGSAEVTRPEHRRNTKERRQGTINWTCRLQYRKPASKGSSEGPDASRSTGPNKRTIQYLFSSSWWPTLKRMWPRTEELSLHDGDYRCPDCQAFALRFSVFMHFD